MDLKTLDNFKTLVIVFVVIAFLYLFIFNTKEKKFDYFKAPAPIIEAPTPIISPSVLSSGGPNTPNIRVPNVITKQNDIYDFVPNDPQDELYSSQDIKDNLRHPERLFGPGIVNSGTTRLLNGGVASNRMLNTPQAIQPFNNELVQNGGLFGKIGANDTNTDPSYSSF